MVDNTQEVKSTLSSQQVRSSDSQSPHKSISLILVNAHSIWLRSNREHWTNTISYHFLWICRNHNKVPILMDTLWIQNLSE